MTMGTSALAKKACFVVVILGLIWLIGDKDFSVLTALDHHEPSSRIFRSLFQVNLVLFGTAFSLYVWSRSIRGTIISELLFAPISNGSDPNDAESFYSTVDFRDVQEEKENETLPEELAMDAGYASDGEITPPPAESNESSLPTASCVAHLALDVLLIILISLFLFTFSSSTSKSTNSWRLFSRIAAPTFPLMLFLYLSYQLVFPLAKRKNFWLVLYATPAAPWYPVTFRDGFIGDILTSSVRPLQDISFTVLYILFGLRSWWSSEYDESSFINNADASVPVMERSWLLHTIALPMCMVSPLWWRYLQNLRQTHDERRRWPYLGNALKYFVAAQVAMFGVFQPLHKETFTWIGSFVVATLYQVWWDVFMDWSLLERRNGRWQLRRERLYKKKLIYWSIFGVNFVLRFCWTLSFLPVYYLNAAGMLTKNFSGDLTAFFGPTIAVAEILRRTLWGLLRVEWQAIQVAGIKASIHSSGEGSNDADSDEDAEEDEVEMTPMNMKDFGDLTVSLSSKPHPSLIDMSGMDSVQVLLELGLYAAVFCAIGLVAAAHRGTL
jgi:hypothetical protein